MIPVNEPLLGSRELDYVTECVRTGWISSAGRFIEEFEEQSAKFYEELSHGNTDHSGLFLSCAGENRKFVKIITRTYYSVISDALEGGYAFDLDTDSYTFDSTIRKEMSDDAALTQAVELENNIVSFYTDAANQSKSLMADLPRQFELIVKKRHKRIKQFRALEANNH